MSDALPLIEHDELRRRLGDAALTIVDVLPAETYRQAHLPGARNHGLPQLASRAEELLPDRHADIVLYCANPG